MGKMTRNRNNFAREMEDIAQITKRTMALRIAEQIHILRRRIIATAVLGTLIGFIAGYATAEATAAPPLTRALHTAQHYWGASRCHGPIAVDLNPDIQRSAIPGATVEAWVLFETPDGFMDWNSPTYTQCDISLNPEIWPNEKVMRLNYPEFCQIILHEYGHFMGWADSTEYSTRDIRYPLMTLENRPRICYGK